MEKLPTLGRYLFAIALTGIAIEHFIYDDFILGRAPAWPEAWPGKLFWAYLTGTLFIASGVAIATGKKGRQAAALTALLVFLWALLRHIPVLLNETFLSGAWTSAGKALVFTSGALAVATTLPKVMQDTRSPLSRFVNKGDEFIVTARICLGIFFTIAGIQHFMFTPFVASLIPVWFPGSAMFWTYFGGVTLLAGGLGLFIPKTASLAALLSAIMVFSWFWIIHLPRVFVSVSDNIAVFEALMVPGIAFVLTRFPREK